MLYVCVQQRQKLRDTVCRVAKKKKKMFVMKPNEGKSSKRRWWWYGTHIYTNVSVSRIYRESVSRCICIQVLSWLSWKHLLNFYNIIFFSLIIFLRWRNNNNRIIGRLCYIYLSRLSMSHNRWLVNPVCILETFIYMKKVFFYYYILSWNGWYCFCVLNKTKVEHVLVIT